MATPPGRGPAWTPPPRGPVAERGPRVGARVVDLLVEAVLATAVLLAFGDGDRPLAAMALVWATIVVYETATVTWWGATLGKRAVGLRTVALDTPGHPPAAAAARRAAANASLAVIPVIGWAVWCSSLTDTLGRGVADRAATTMVVPTATATPIASHDLPGYADGARAPRLHPLGRVGDLDVRARARLRRLADAPLLALAVGLLALAAALPVSTLTVIIISSLAWVAAFVADETWRVHTRAATAGHRLAGLVIRDRRTGNPPGVGRSLLRALTLGLTLYVPLLWPLLLVSAAMVRWGDTGRGLHDVLGGTVVVADPSLEPEQQRQLAMRMRLGRAG